MIDYLILSWFYIFLQPTNHSHFLKLLQNTYWSVLTNHLFIFQNIQSNGFQTRQIYFYTTALINASSMLIFDCCYHNSFVLISTLLDICICCKQFVTMHQSVNILFAYPQALCDDD